MNPHHLRTIQRKIWRAGHQRRLARAKQLLEEWVELFKTAN